MTSGLDILERLPAGLSCIMKRITFALEDATSQEQGPRDQHDKFLWHCVMNLPQFLKRTDVHSPLIWGEECCWKTYLLRSKGGGQNPSQQWEPWKGVGMELCCSAKPTWAIPSSPCCKWEQDPSFPHASEQMFPPARLRGAAARWKAQH